LSNPVLRLAYSSVSKRAKANLLILVASRIFTNLLDLVGIVGVGLLAVQFVSSNSNGAGYKSYLGQELPQLSQNSALVLSAGIMFVFILKSISAIWISSKSLDVLAEQEAQLVERLTVKLPRYFNSNGALLRESSVQMAIGTGTKSLISGQFSAILTIISEISLLFLILGSLAIANLMAAIVMLSYFGLVAVVLTYFVSTKTRNFTKLAEKKLHSLYTDLSDIRQVSSEIQVFGQQEAWATHVVNERLQISQLWKKLQTLYSLPRYVIETSLIVGVFLLVGSFVFFGDLKNDAGSIGIFIAGSLRLTAALIPLQNAFNLLKVHESNAQFVLDLREHLESLPLDSRKITFDPEQKHNLAVRVKNLSVKSLNGQPANILEDLSFEIKRGDKFAIIGPSGSGKTTLLKIIAGLFPPSGGEVEIFLSSTDRSGAISYIPQKPELISGGIIKNLTVIPAAPEEWPSNYQDVLSELNLHKFRIAKKDDKLKGSGGEVQRIGIARALITEPEIIIVDEATSALDSKNEAAITALLNQKRGLATQIIVAHRISTIKDADQVLYLDGGKAIAFGTYEEVSKKVSSLNPSGIE
jgi:ABC-type multidrug transport system fused ATPase/permease subunit